MTNGSSWFLDVSCLESLKDSMRQRSVRPSAVSQSTVIATSPWFAALIWLETGRSQSPKSEVRSNAAVRVTWNDSKLRF